MYDMLMSYDCSGSSAYLGGEENIPAAASAKVPFQGAEERRQIWRRTSGSTPAS